MLSRGDGPFPVLKKINDNAYVLDIPQEYGDNSTFNVSGLSLFDASMNELNLRTNSFQEREFDTNQGGQEESKEDIARTPRDNLQGPLTRGKLKRLEADMRKRLKPSKISQHLRPQRKRFVKDFSTRAVTLNEIVKKKSQERVFQALKERLTRAPILALSKFSKSFEFEYDIDKRIFTVILHASNKLKLTIV
ncbi:hypothetical protein CR513_12987, partial [Mucuna pruriens]